VVGHPNDVLFSSSPLGLRRGKQLGKATVLRPECAERIRLQDLPGRNTFAVPVGAEFAREVRGLRRFSVHLTGYYAFH
jgi:hypothetical protein